MITYFSPLLKNYHRIPHYLSSIRGTFSPHYNFPFLSPSLSQVNALLAIFFRDKQVSQLRSEKNLKEEFQMETA